LFRGLANVVLQQNVLRQAGGLINRADVLVPGNRLIQVLQHIMSSDGRGRWALPANQP
jgi:hypothetical protein